MKFYTAEKIFDGHVFHDNSVVACTEEGVIEEITHASQVAGENLIVLDGILSPGFVNSHCHLELSHLRGKIAKHTGLDAFIKSIEDFRHAEASEIINAASTADQEQQKNGIAAVGDISNSIHTREVKQNSRIRYYTFAEVFAFSPERAETAFGKGKELVMNFDDLPASVTPHAPYSASVKLLKLISEDSYRLGTPLTIHMEESEDEDLLFTRKQGKILDRLKRFGIDASGFEPTGFSSLRSTLVHLTRCSKLQLVHNTFVKPEDIQWAEDLHPLLFWCFCPNANLYIENTLPDFKAFYDQKVRWTIGTDSLASNDQLDIVSELRVINQHAPTIPLTWLLNAATLNGAYFLGFNEMGELRKGKKPSLILLKGFDPASNRISVEAESFRIL